jgi:methionyl-tRNA formyltransferase
LIRGETKGGLTVFWTDAGIDTGPILLQKEVPIGPDDTAGSLYYEKIFPLGLDAMEEAVRLVEEGRAPRIPQDESRATHDPLCRDPHVAIDWTRPARETYDLVRGADPQPGAWAVLRGERIRFYDARLEPSRAGSTASGVVGGIDDRGARVGVPGGTLVVARMKIGDSPKKPARDLAAAEKLRPGDRFEAGAP